MTAETHGITLQDLIRLADAEAPDLVQAMVGFADQDESEREDPPPDALDLQGLRVALAQARAVRTQKQRQERAYEVWKRYLGQSEGVAPQMALAELVVRLYETPTGPARQALLALIAEAPLVFGLWGGLKRVYKRAEADLDPQVFGALAARIDAELEDAGRRDVSRGTLVYLSRRSWRHLRQIGKGMPELYPGFAVEVLRSYPSGHRLGSTGGAHIVAHYSEKWGYDKAAARKQPKFTPPFVHAWKRSADPLLLLLETCRSDVAARFAINGLRELFPSVLRKVSPEWLARLCSRPLGAAHELVVETLEGSPEYHAGKLEELGLHDAVLALLRSPSKKARAYAITYARGHSRELSTELLVGLVDGDVHPDDIVTFAATLLTGRPAREVGLPLVVRLLRYRASRKWAQTALENEFEAHELTHPLLADLVLRDDISRWVRPFLKKRFSKGALPPAFWIGVLADPRIEDAGWDTADYVLEQLGTSPVSALPAEWLLAALQHDDWSDTVSGWLEQADALPPGLDAERIKGLVFDPATRDVAFSLLGNPKVVPAMEVGVSWLLALARRADPSLHQWAHRYLLQHVRPEHFEDDPRAAAARLFALATGAKEPEAARVFAQTYLLCHHPKIGRQQPESKELGIKPLLPRDVYSLALVWPTLGDDRPDVRRFGVTLARAELRRWREPHRVYELAESPAREVRNVAYDALQQAGEPNADPDLALSVDDLDPAMVFSLTESTIGGTRDVAMALIRKHYPRLGGAERLGWLMQSADREVRSFAVRLLWEKHRPRTVPAGWKAPGSQKPAPPSTPFDDAEALRDLLRRLLFAVPPARGSEKGDRRSGKLPANAAKRRIVEVVRDFGVLDRDFASLVTPVLEEFTGSIAKGEWQACLSAVMTLRAAHGHEGTI